MLTVDATEDPKTVAAPVEPYTPSEMEFLNEIAASYPHPIRYMMTAEASKVVAEKWRLAVLTELAEAAKTATPAVPFTPKYIDSQDQYDRTMRRIDAIGRPDKGTPEYSEQMMLQLLIDHYDDGMVWRHKYAHYPSASPLTDEEKKWIASEYLPAQLAAARKDGEESAARRINDLRDTLARKNAELAALRDALAATPAVAELDANTVTVVGDRVYANTTQHGNGPAPASD